MLETELYDPVRRWLEGQGYVVAAEVKHCDVVAYPPSDPESLIVVELKRRMSLDLLIQASRRKEITEAVYVAVPLQGSRARLRNGRDLRALLRRLETGLIVVRFLRDVTRVEVMLHPLPFRPRTAHARRRRIIREIDGRYAEFDKAGQPAGTLRLSAWRQRCIAVALMLRDCGPSSPAELVHRGAPEQTQRILSGNAYGWFERVRHGLYCLSAAGGEAMRNLPPGTEELLGASRLSREPRER